MLLFRSEEHVNQWCSDRAIARGAVLSLDQCWELAKAEYKDRMLPDWRWMTREETRQLFDDLGLTGPFWAMGTPASDV